MAYRANHNRFTIYDAMEAKGVFALNPANIDARDSEGAAIYEKAEYPKMFYSPKGEERVTEPARIEPSPVGPQTIPARFEMISRTAKDLKEEKELRAAGWHDHPAKALAAAGKIAPAFAPGEAEISDLKAQIAKLQDQLATKELSETPPVVLSAIAPAAPPKTTGKQG